MNGATPSGSTSGLRSWYGSMNRSVVVAGIVLAAVVSLAIGLRRWGWARSAAAAEETVSRDRLVLREGRWMKTDETNMFTGLMVDFYPDGTLQSRSAVSNGLLHGLSEGWWTNAVLAVRETFQDGRSHGVRTKWDIEARRISETDIREGRIDGFHREWHTNGQLAVEAAMASGLPSGRSRRWSLDGALVGQWSLSNGVVVTSMTNAVELQALAQKGGTP